MSWFVPGRVEVFGKHTDYAGGRSLLAAVDRGVTVTALPSDEAGIVASSAQAPDQVRLVAGQDPQLPPGHWGGYVQVVIDRLTANFGPLAPAHLTVESSLPLASGMSSSSALVVGLAMALVDQNGFEHTERWQAAMTDRIDLAGYLACFENGMTFKNLAGHRGVGTFGGSEDHTGMLCCAPGSLSQFSFCPIRPERDIRFPPDHAVVIAVSGVAAEKTGAARDAYNRASLATKEIVARWNDTVGDHAEVIADIVTERTDSATSGPLDEDRAARLSALVSQEPYLRDRLHQFLTESYRLIPAAGEALANGDWAGFGAAADESMSLATRELGNQVPQTVALADQARSLGAVAASAFGAGFGGSVWAMVRLADAEEFAQSWLAGYQRAYPAQGAEAEVLVTRPAEPAYRF